jgi:4-hydroxybenzoate polyprenyltransferase
VKPLIQAMRPRQWTKNLLVFAGLIFSGRFTDSSSVTLVLLLFAAFCLTSSAGYLINDVLDREADAQHPEKRERPIASGRLKASTAVAFAVALLAGGFLIAVLCRIPIGVEALLFYVLNQAFYTSVAKSIAVLDVFIISQGFVVRAVAGAVALSVTISAWLLLCTFLLALFLGFAKRKHEYDLGSKSRASLSGYSTKLLDQFIGISAASAVLAYSVYAIQSDTAHKHGLLVLTVPLPIFGIFRYLQLTYQRGDGGNPDRALVRDPWMAGTVLLWAILSLYAMSQEGRLPL